MEKEHGGKPQGRQVRIEIDEKVADGDYANLAFITSNESEFIFDFARYLPGNSRGKVMSRIVLAPAHAKNFLKSLTEAVNGYEKKFGDISPNDQHKNIGFRVDTEKGEE